MSETESAPSIIDQAVDGLDTVTTVLAKVGIEISPLAGQGVLLILLLALLFLARKKIFPLTIGSSLGLVPALVGTGIIFSWIYQVFVPLPDHVFGKVFVENSANLSVELLDFQSHVIPPGSAPVDSVTGDFAIRFTPSFGDHPRTVVVYREGCVRYLQEITRQQIVAQSRVDIRFTCKEEGA